MYVVYLHTNKVNGKAYVGYAEIYRGCETPDAAMMKRWQGHLKHVRHGSSCYFHNAIRKCGSNDDVWTHEVLDVLTTLEGAKLAEKLWIVQRRTFAYDEGSWGYNTTRGGEGSLGHVYKHTSERKRKISAALTGRPVSQETRNKLRDVQKRSWQRRKEKQREENVQQPEAVREVSD